MGVETLTLQFIQQMTAAASNNNTKKIHLAIADVHAVCLTRYHTTPNMIKIAILEFKLRLQD